MNLLAKGSIWHYEQFTTLQSVSVANCGNFNHLQIQAVVLEDKS